MCSCTSADNKKDDNDKPDITIKGFEFKAIEKGHDENDPNNTFGAVNVRVVYKNLDEGYTLKVKCYYNGSIFSSIEHQDPNINGSTGSTIGLLLRLDGEKIPTKFTVSVLYRGKEMDDKEYFPTRVGEPFGDI